MGVGLGQAGQGQQAGEAVQDKMLLQQGGADRLFALNSETRAIGASAKGRAGVGVGVGVGVGGEGQRSGCREWGLGI